MSDMQDLVDLATAKFREGMTKGEQMHGVYAKGMVDGLRIAEMALIKAAYEVLARRKGDVP